MSFQVKNRAKKLYVSDSIGNRSSATNNSETTQYQANFLNQYSSTTSNSATNNFSFDADGNMLTDGDWVYTWNGENRMTLASNSEHVISFSYDFMGRCYERVKDGETTEFVWDGYNIISEASNSQTNYNIWGLDLSGSLQGAGGVGGLLCVSVDSVVYYPAFDANGNITEYVADDGTVVAHREYSPFGETIALTGTKQDDFTHWWSTKPWDVDTGMSEYEYRKYLMSLGSWGSRDPIGEWGGENLYGFLRNNGMNSFDILGQKKGCCDGSLYDTSARCCCDKGTVVLNGGSGSTILQRWPARGTGVKKCRITGRQNPNGPYPHAWIEFDKTSAGFRPGWEGHKFGYPGQVTSPDSLQGTVSCQEIKLSPCKYDIEKFKQAVRSFVEQSQNNPPNYNYPIYVCHSWVGDCMKSAYEKAKGCTD